jgi:leucyl/phenylalanyl-tRNA---protein transferase
LFRRLTGKMGKETDTSIIDPQLLINAYKNSFFPMADSRGGPIKWYSPDPRAIIPLDGLKISRSLKQTIKKNTFKILVDTAFEEVMRHCAERTDTWISEPVIQSYLGLYNIGYAHSIEAWKESKLAGGLYGVSIGSAFFGESMFSIARDASKVALVFLIDHLKNAGYQLLDTQFMTPHLRSLGAVEISRTEYLRILNKAVNKESSFVN